jgi:UDP-N-acetylglucosamine 2-epimerase
MPSLRTYDLFISHAWSYGEDYYRIVEMLDAAPNFSWRNFSVPEDDPLHGGSARQLREGLDRQMRRVHVVLVLSGVYATHSGWMQEELAIAEAYDKPIVGIFPRASQRASAAVQDAASEMVGWNTASIVDAIRRHAI